VETDSSGLPNINANLISTGLKFGGAANAGIYSPLPLLAVSGGNAYNLTMTNPWSRPYMDSRDTLMTLWAASLFLK